MGLCGRDIKWEVFWTSVTVWRDIAAGQRPFEIVCLGDERIPSCNVEPCRTPKIAYESAEYDFRMCRILKSPPMLDSGLGATSKHGELARAILSCTCGQYS